MILRAFTALAWLGFLTAALGIIWDSGHTTQWVWTAGLAAVAALATSLALFQRSQP